MSSSKSEVPLGPSIATAEHVSALFQTDTAINEARRRRAKKERAFGNPLELPTKILSMVLAPTIEGGEEVLYAYVGGANHSARKVNLKTGKTVRLYQGHGGPVTSVALVRRRVNESKEEEWIVTGSWDKTLRVWDAQTRQVIAIMRGHTDFIKHIAVGKDHLVEGAKTSHPTTVYSVSADGTARRWDLATGKCLKIYEDAHRGPIESVTVTVGTAPDVEAAQSLDGVREWLWTAGTDGTIQRWDALTGKLVATLTGHLTSVYHVHAPSNSDADAELWSASADKTVRRWDLDMHTEDTQLEHPDAVRCVSVVGPYVVTGSRDEHVRVFNIATGRLEATIVGHYDEVTSIGAHGGVLYTASLDTTIRRWELADISSGKYLVPVEEVYEKLPDVNNNAPAANAQSSMLTEEEERELAELMSDLDD